MGRDNIRAQNEVARSFNESSFVVIYRTAKVSSHEQPLANDKQNETLDSVRIRLDGGETLSDFFTRSRLDSRRRLLLDSVRDGIVEKEGKAG